MRIDESAIAAYAQGLTAAADLGPPDPKTELLEDDRETRAAFAICVNAIKLRLRLVTDDPQASPAQRLLDRGRRRG